MARMVCITIGTKTYCSGSPIRDCSCTRDDTFKDAYRETPERLDDPKKRVVATFDVEFTDTIDVGKVIEAVEGVHGVRRITLQRAR